MTLISHEDMWNKLQEKIIGIAVRLGRPISLLLDISTLPRFLTGAVLAMGLARGISSRLTVFYSEGTYTGDVGDLQGIFTGERWKFVPINGLEGHYDSSKSRFYLVSVGFEGSKTLRYVSTHEPDRVSVLIADPGFEASYAARSRANNEDLIRYFHIPPEQTANAHAGDAVAVWSELDVRYFERFESENVSYLCCGTKPHSLGLMLRAMCLGSPCVLYNIPDQHKVINTQPTGKVWTYEFHDVTRLSKSDEGI
jgi:hypothetical protein